VTTRLVIVGPLPPPHHGVSVSTQLVLANHRLNERFAVEHFDTSDHRTIQNVGRWDVRNVTEALGALPRLVRQLRGEPGIFYLPISQGIPGLVRDTLFIRIASEAGWKVAAHLRGSELGGVYRRQPRILRAWLRNSLERVDSLAVLGESVSDVLEGVLPPERVAVVPNGTPDPQISASPQNDTGVYLGNLYQRKGALEAMEAALMVTRERPGAKFVFAGGVSDERFRRRLEQLGARANGQIRIRPPVLGPEKDELLASAGYLLFPPARQEGHPRVVLEAMAAGLPVITTNRGTIAETVIDQESGFVLSAPIPEDLRDRMLRLYDDPALRAAMGSAARRRYLDRYTQEAADAALAEWLDGLAHDPARSSPMNRVSRGRDTGSPKQALKGLVLRALRSEASTKIVGPLVKRRVRHMGATLTIDSTASAKVRAQLFWNLYERSEVKLVRKHLAGSRAVIDLGSGLGVTATHLASIMAPGGTLVCVEANPDLLPAIKRSASRYADRSEIEVSVLNRAIGDPGWGTLERAHRVASTRVVSNSANSNGQRVESLQLAEIAEGAGLNAFDLVCDIEGAEASFIDPRPGEKSGLEHCDRLVIELHSTQHGDRDLGEDELLELLQERWGFDVLERRGRVVALARPSSDVGPAAQRAHARR
jgi:FkbM family methyltransferase